MSRPIFMYKCHSSWMDVYVCWWECMRAADLLNAMKRLQRVSPQEDRGPIYRVISQLKELEVHKCSGGDFAAFVDAR